MSRDEVGNYQVLYFAGAEVSCVFCKFGLWPAKISVWGNWENFVAYTKTLLPFLPNAFVTVAAIVATALEILLAVLLLINFKTTLVAKCACFLLLAFALAMLISLNIKAPLDYSVFTAAAAAFALSALHKKK